jgi:hypothetical protein
MEVVCARARVRVRVRVYVCCVVFSDDIGVVLNGCFQYLTANDGLRRGRDAGYIRHNRRHDRTAARIIRLRVISGQCHFTSYDSRPNIYATAWSHQGRVVTR